MNLSIPCNIPMTISISYYNISTWTSHGYIVDIVEIFIWFIYIYTYGSSWDIHGISYNNDDKNPKHSTRISPRTHHSDPWLGSIESSPGKIDINLSIDGVYFMGNPHENIGFFFISTPTKGWLGVLGASSHESFLWVITRIFVQLPRKDDWDDWGQHLVKRQSEIPTKYLPCQKGMSWFVPGYVPIDFPRDWWNWPQIDTLW